MPMAAFAAGGNAALVMMPTSLVSATALSAARAFAIADCAAWLSTLCASVSWARRRVSGVGGSALDNFLAGVAAFGEADVRRFQRGFVRNHGVVEVSREPRDAGFQAQGVHRAHADRGAVLRDNAGMKIAPQQSEMGARSDNFRAR